MILFFMHFSRFSLYILKVTAKYLLQQTHICDNLTLNDEILFNSSTKLALEIFSNTQNMQGNLWFVDISVGYGSNSQWLRFPIFNSCEHIFWTVRQTSRKLRKSCWKKWSLRNKGSICYEVKFRLPIYHVMCWFIILIEMIFKISQYFLNWLRPLNRHIPDTFVWNFVHRNIRIHHAN